MRSGTKSCSLCPGLRGSCTSIGGRQAHTFQATSHKPQATSREPRAMGHGERLAPGLAKPDFQREPGCFAPAGGERTYRKVTQTHTFQATSHKPQATSHKPQATSHKLQATIRGPWRAACAGICDARFSARTRRPGPHSTGAGAPQCHTNAHLITLFGRCGGWRRHSEITV